MDHSAPERVLLPRGPHLAAELDVDGASASLTWPTGPTWSLSKTGTLAGSVVTWTIVAAEGPAAPGALVVRGKFPLSNPGDAPAPVGNVVINLQRRVSNKWVTAASDVADAPAGDGATSARVHAQATSEGKGEFTENSASGPLTLSDPAAGGAAVSLTAPLVLGPGASWTLEYRAAFDAVALGLAPGEAVRLEVLVSYGNAPKGNSTANLDINGNGAIDASEARVRSAVTRVGLAVPNAVLGAASVTLTDGLDDITTTGTVTFSNPQFGLGPSGGTVTVTVDGGAEGGTITNCAQLTGAAPNGGNLTTCSPVEIPAVHACTAGAAGCGWETGDLVTFSQGDWGNTSGTAQNLLSAHFDNVYVPTAGLHVGILGSGGFSITFTNVASVSAYLPAFGGAGPLTSDVVNPMTTVSGSFGGNTVALKLNVDFSDRGFLGGAAPIAFGDVRICGVAPLPDVTVREFLAIANTALAGGTTGYAIADLDAIALQLNGSFLDGPGAWAQQHLFTGSCP